MYTPRAKVYIMQTSLTATRLRKALFSTLDHVAETGESVEIQRPGGTVRIVREDTGQRLAALRPHPGIINGTPEALASLSWEQDWKPIL